MWRSLINFSRDATLIFFYSAVNGRTKILQHYWHI